MAGRLGMPSSRCFEQISRRRTGARDAAAELAGAAWLASPRSCTMAAIFSSLLCGLGTSGCSMDPSILMATPKGSVAPMLLIVDTLPSGGQAQVRNGMSCQTPCELTVTPMGPFMVDFTFKKYEPLSVEVVLAPLSLSDLSAGIRAQGNSAGQSASQAEAGGETIQAETRVAGNCRRHLTSRCKPLTERKPAG
jgi:hypothetical protein